MRLLPKAVTILILASAGPATFASDVTIEGVFDGKKPVQGMVAYLEGGPKSTPMKKYLIDQRDKTFVPHVSVVTVGTTVEFPNNDVVFHNVFAYFHAKKFDLGMYPRGSTKTVKFDRTGLVAMYCNVHSEMSAFIMVVDTPYYGISGKSGSVVLKDIPPGKYTLQVWQESAAPKSVSVIIDSNNQKIPVQLSRK